MLRDSGAAARADDCAPASTTRRVRRTAAKSRTAKKPEPVIIPCYEASCGTRPRKLPQVENGVITPNKSQHASRRALGAAMHALLTKPTGSGKSIDILTQALCDLEDTGRKQIVTYSLTDIASGFGGPGCKEPKKIRIPGRGVLTWTPIHASDQTIETIIDFLRKPSKRPADRMLICTHLALVLAHEEMLKRGYERPFKGCSLYIDECHHISWDLSSGTPVLNGLGKIVEHYCTYKLGKLLLATATFMRPDGQILPPQFRELFVTYELPMHEHLASMVHLKGIRFHFVMASAVDAVRMIIGNDPERPTLMWIPNNVVGDAKAAYVKKLIDATPKSIRDRLYDFTDDEKVPELRERFHALKWDSVEYPRLGIALRRLLEGVDYPMASRGIILGLRGVRDIIQMVGRFIRDCEGKSHADIYIVVDPPSEDEADIVEHLENNLSAVMIAMVAGWQYGPPRKPRNKADREAGRILSNPEATDLVMRAVARAVARHADGEPDQLKAGMHEAMRRLAEDRPDLAALTTSAVRSRFVDDVNERMSGPAAEAEKKLKYKLPGLKGARELTGLTLTPEQSLARNITIMGFACGATSMKMLREGLYRNGRIDLSLDDIREAFIRSWEGTGSIPHQRTASSVSIQGVDFRWTSLERYLRTHFNSSLGKLKHELLGYCRGSFHPTRHQVAQEAARYIQRHGTRPSANSGQFGDSHITWRTANRHMNSEGTSVSAICNEHFGPLYFTYSEWRAYVLSTSVPGYDLLSSKGYFSASRAGLLDVRCPADPQRMYERTGDWLGWNFRKKRGSSMPLAKLTESDIPTVRRRLANGDSMRSIAGTYGVSPTVICNIKRGRNWAHVS